MIGIDTNILVRLLVRDDDVQVRAAEQLISRRCSFDEPGFVSSLVIAEVAWVLGNYYQYDRAQVARAIRGLMEISALKFDAEDEVDMALKDFQSSSAGFIDCLLARLNASAGCEHTFTFDRKAAKLPGFKLLPGA